MTRRPTTGLRRMMTLPAVASACVVAACAVSHPPVSVTVAPDAHDFAGVWEGTYESRDTGRTGSITLALTALGDSAVGEVVMVPRGQGAVVRRDDDQWQWEGIARPQILTIRFVRVASVEVVGQLDLYRDPDCGCLLQTTFRGEIEGDIVTGTFNSMAEHAEHSAEGTWRAVRRTIEPSAR